jgi:hypothetical protein
MGDTMNKDETTALDLMATIIASNVDSAKWTSDRLITGYKADAEAIYDGVQWALSTAEWGGTTRQYEQTLEHIARALHPSPAIRDWYISRVERFLSGEDSQSERESVYPGYELKGCGYE